MLFRVKQKLVTGKHGRKMSAYQPLVERGNVPSSGWSVEVTVRGTQMPCRGRTPFEVKDVLAKLLTLNKIEHDENMLWTTLNLEWLARSDQRLHLVSLTDLLSVVEAPDREEFRGRLDLESWLLPALDNLGYSLSIDNDYYRFDGFNSLVTMIVAMANPSKAHRLGDHAALATLLERHAIIRYKPCHLLAEAKTWFVDTYNAVTSSLSITPLTTETATNKYRWDNGTQD